MTSGLTAQDRDLGGQPMVHLSSHNPPSSDCAAPGEGWAEGPSAEGRASALPAAGAVGETPAGVGGAASEPASDAAAAASPQSAHSPQMVRKTAENGQHRRTTANVESAAQDGFSVKAHSAKPPLGRFCKAGVRGSIPLVSTPSIPSLTGAFASTGGSPERPRIAPGSKKSARSRSFAAGGDPVPGPQAFPGRGDDDPDVVDPAGGDQTLAEGGVELRGLLSGVHHDRHPARCCFRPCRRDHDDPAVPLEAAAWVRR